MIVLSLVAILVLLSAILGFVGSRIGGLAVIFVIPIGLAILATTTLELRHGPEPSEIGAMVLGVFFAVDAVSYMIARFVRNRWFPPTQDKKEPIQSTTAQRRDQPAEGGQTPSSRRG